MKLSKKITATAAATALASAALLTPVANAQTAAVSYTHLTLPTSDLV